MRKLLKNKRGEGYIDVAITVMIVAFVLVFMVNIVSLVALNQNIKTAADQIAEYASMNGTTDIDAFVAEQREKLGVDFYCSFSGSQTIDSSGKVQLGDSIVCTLTHDISFMGFGGEIHFTTVTASATGLSQVYWK